jgi:DNA-binding PadR family transcriptional regulator
MTTRPDPRSFLPLTPAVLHILLTLVDGPRHGYGIAKDVGERTDGDVKLGPGTLYGTLGRMVDAGLAKEASASDGADDRRRYYRITPLGRDVIALEARRLAAIVAVARKVAVI